jgi:hypothetical protein
VTIEVHSNFGNVLVTRVGDILSLTVVGKVEIDQLQRCIDAYLNTKPESIGWLWQLSDALNPVAVPERQEDWK